MWCRIKAEGGLRAGWWVKWSGVGEWVVGWLGTIKKMEFVAPVCGRGCCFTLLVSVKNNNLAG